MPARGGIDHGVIEHVTDVQRSGDVRRRNGQRKSWAGRMRIGVKDAGRDPPFCPMRLETLRFVCFFQFHGESISLASGHNLTALKGDVVMNGSVACLCSSVAQW